MADLLRIRKGTLNSLKEITTKTPGTIYVTTDEKAMYVDISNTERIRLGQIITLDSKSDWENLEPPYSTDAFYYIVEQNALIKYTGSAWKQINAPTDLSSLTKKVTDLETAVGSKTDTSNKDTAFGRIKKNAEDIATNATAITGLGTRLSTAEGEIDTLQSEMDAVEKKASDNADAITSLRSDVNANTTAIGQNKTSIEGINGKIGTAGAGQDGTIYELIAGNTSAITSNDGDISKLNTTVYGDAAGTGTAGLVGSVSTNTSNISSLSNKVTGLETTVGNHTTSIGKNTNDITNLRTDLGNKGDAASADSAFGRIAKNTANIATNAGNIATNTSNISKNATAITGLTSRVGANETAIKGLDGRLDTAESDISTLQGTVGEHTTSIGTINSAIGKDTDAANASGSLYARIAQNVKDINTNKTNISSNTNKITSLETLIGDSDDTGSGTIYGLINGKVDADDYAIDKAALEKKINDEIIAVNAMTYKGTTSTALASDKANTKIGDTYVASDSFKQGQIDVNPGDLLIASGTEDTTGPNIGYISNITWQHVNTGYNQSHRDSLTGAGNAISLTSYTGQDLGSVAFESKAVNGNTSALTVAVANNKVTLAVEWENF